MYPEYVKVVKEIMDDMEMKYEITMDDVGRAIELENPVVEDEEELINRKGIFINFFLF